MLFAVVAIQERYEGYEEQSDKDKKHAVLAAQHLIIRPSKQAGRRFSNRALAQLDARD